MKKNNYELKFHDFFYDRVILLVEEVERLSLLLPTETFKQHELTKLLARITKAYSEVIPENPNLPDYYLKGTLSKYRRYKRGLQRYRLLYCFSQRPPIIIYLYINDNHHLRKEGSMSDPYKEFVDLVKRGIFSPNPLDPRMQQWIMKKLQDPNAGPQNGFKQVQQ